MLRQEISEQLGNEIFPEDYVFLKHVGRCLALVRRIYLNLSVLIVLVTKLTCKTGISQAEKMFSRAL